MNAAHDLFVSYAEADRAWVEGYLLNALEASGARVLSEQAFRLGVPRLSEFERAVRQSARVLLVLSPAYLADESAQFVDLLAQSFGLDTATWPVIPLILEPCPLPPRLAMLTSLQATDQAAWPGVVARLCAELQCPVPAPAPAPECPYPGMTPFQEADAGRFYGREREVQEMLDRLRLHPFLTVIGPSGSGKSSVVLAGLVPALKKSGLFGPGEWTVRSMRPGEAPLTDLHAALDAVVDLSGGGRGAAPGTTSTSKVLLIVDQLEELFTRGVGQAGPFQDALLELAKDGGAGVYVVLTVRADFYPDLMGCALWPQVQARRLEVLPLDAEGLRQAVVRPAEGAGVFVDTALVERLVADAAGEPGILPFVQETLVLLWEKVERRYLPLRAYEALVLPGAAYGAPPTTGLQVAMARRADAALQALPPGGQAVARRIFLRLVQFGEGRADTRRQQAMEALRTAGEDEALFWQVLDRLAGSRLLTLTGEEGEKGRRADIAHEALIRGWPALRRWIAERRVGEATRRRLEDKTAEWVRLGRGEGGLLDEVELLEAERWMGSAEAAELGESVDLQALAAASRVAIERVRAEKEAAQRRELEQSQALAEEQKRRADEQARGSRRLRRALAVLAVVFVLALGAAVVAGVLGRQAANSAATATANLGVANVRGTDSAVNLDQARARGTEAALNLAQSQVRGTEAALNLAQSQVRGTAAVAAQGTAESEAHARATQEAVAIQQARIATSRGLEAQAFVQMEQQPDLALLLSAEAMCQYAAFDAQNSLLSALQLRPALEATLRDNWGQVRSVAWRPDGNVLASGGCGVWQKPPACYGAEVQLWDGVTDQALNPIYPSQELVYSVSWRPGGHEAMLAVGGCYTADFGGTCAAGRVELWETATDNALVQTLETGEGAVLSVAWRPDGSVLASGSCSRYFPTAGDCVTGTVQLWDVATGEARGEPVDTGGDSVFDVAWRPDGKVLAVGGCARWDSGRCAAGTVRLWDADTGQALREPINTGRGQVWSVAWGPDGKVLASGDDDGRVRLWNAATGEARGEPIDTGGSAVFDVAWRPDGKVLATAGGDGKVRLWDPATGKALLKPNDASQGEAWSVAWRPSEEAVLASGGGCDWQHQESCTSGTVMLWDAATGQALGERAQTGHSGVSSVAWGAAGAVLASGDKDGTLWLWSLASTSAGNAPGGQAMGGPIDTGQGGVSSLAWQLPDAAVLASGGDDGTVRLWSAATGQPLGKPLSGHEGSVLSLAWGPAAREGVLASGGCARLESGETCGAERVQLWDAATGKALAEPLDNEAYGLSLTTVAWRPDGTILAAGDDGGEIFLWDITTRQAPKWLYGGGSLQGILPVRSLAWRPDGNVLAVVLGRGDVWLADPATEELTLLKVLLPSGAAESGGQSLAWRPDGTVLAAGGSLGEIWLWDGDTGKALGQPLQTGQGDVLSLAWRSDGKKLASADGNGTAWLWDLDPVSWQAHACRAAGRNLSQAEWNQFVGSDVPYHCTCPDLPPGDGARQDACK